MASMKLNRRNLAPIHCASTDSTRYSINALRFEEDGTTVATDGHILAVVKPGKVIDAKLDPFSVELEGLAPFQKEQRKKNPARARLDIKPTNDNGACYLSSGGVDTRLPKVVGDFVDWRTVANAVHSDSAQTTVGISLADLEKIVSTARQFSDTRKGDITAMRFEFTEDALSPFRVSCEDANSGDQLEITVMPVRL